VPVDAGVGLTLGFLGAPIAYEVVRTLLVRLDALEQATIDALFAEMRAEAEAVVRLGVPQGALVAVRTGFMRYRGQGHEVAVPLPDGRLDPAALRMAFDATYARVYGRVIPRLKIQALTWTTPLSEPYALPAQLRLPLDAGVAVPSGRCRIIETASGEVVDASVFVRAALSKGARLVGPAVIVEDGSSTILPSGYTAWIGAGDDIVNQEIET
jgi:N-methylhydantoinase A